MSDDDIIVQFKDGTKQRYAATARETIERLRGKDIFHIHGVDEPDKKQVADKSINVNVVAIRLLKKGMKREDVAEVLGINITLVPDIQIAANKAPAKLSGPANTVKNTAPPSVDPELKEQVAKLITQKQGINKIANKTGLSVEQIQEIKAELTTA